MKQSFLFFIVAGIGLMAAQCTSNPSNSNKDSTAKITNDSAAVKGKTDTVVEMSGINSKGIGRFKDIQLSHPVNEKMAAAGQAIYGSKCFACHKLTNELLVGPGWKGVTDRRTPEWIMNWITNTKVMIDKDLAAQADMAVCLIRMPNQDLTDEQARDVLEFMRKNDGKN
ncbi:MAG: cytochrome c [Bacteroidetes bacterium]|nr:cytochrome c [Bacteroidota bacterium]